MASKEQRSRDITIQIFRVILEHINGHGKKEIVDNQLAEDCEYSPEFDAIQKIVKSQI